MSAFEDSTLDWYIQFLTQRYPDWTPEQRLEVATGFVNQQKPPQRPAEIEEEPEPVGEEEIAEARRSSPGRAALLDRR
jgi:hypothetical protein